MSRYIVGDIQGCATELKLLLQQVGFDPSFDQLWCVGDLVGRGPDSLACLQFLHDLGSSAKVVLGNHDLNLMAILAGVRAAHPSDKLDAIVALPQLEQQHWLAWLVQQPLMLTSNDGLVMSHAGIYPWWSLAEAQDYADETSAALQQAWQQQQLGEWLASMYGNEPNRWHPDLSGADRHRFIINALTRMRYCRVPPSYDYGELELTCKTAPQQQRHPSDLVPWYELTEVTDNCLVFGHWAALMGQTQRDDVIGLDTGCVWGNQLTLLRWPTGEIVSLPCQSDC